MIDKPDVVIVGSGAAGLFCSLSLPKDKRILIITKKEADCSDSFLAQGGICTLRDGNDYESFYEDTMRAGHYENNHAAVDLMIRKSPEIIDALLGLGVRFEQKDGRFVYTREGAHSRARILYHEDVTGKEITGKLLSNVRSRENIRVVEHTTMLDILHNKNRCTGVIAAGKYGSLQVIPTKAVVFATGGIGGLFENTTNYRHLTGDAIAIALKHKIKVTNLNYIQVHPTALYTKTEGRRFLISESVRGEGGVLLSKNMERFVDELLPRDEVTKAILKQMEKDKTKHVWLSVKNMKKKTIVRRFPNIYFHCLSKGYDMAEEPIPVTPVQHYLMGGIQVDCKGRTSMEQLYAIGETCHNGVHGANRLASNSLLESLVFAKEAAIHIRDTINGQNAESKDVDLSKYENIQKIQSCYKDMIIREIEREKQL